MQGVLFQETIDFLTKRLAMTPDDFNDLARSLDAAATDRAIGMQDAMVRGILEAIEEALRNGTTADSFRQTFDDLAAAQGWKGDNSEGWRSKLTFRVLTGQAMAAGRWQQIQRLKSTRPYLRYVTAGDHRVRDAHRQWHNVILDADDPWWQTHFPPNGFNCRCHVQQLSARDLVRYGLTVSDAAPPIETVIKYVRLKGGGQKAVEVPKGIDPGFAYNPGVLGLMLNAGLENDPS
jgi:SPP1 gp7 family putative phage head morphogenesis protein